MRLTATFPNQRWGAAVGGAWSAGWVLATVTVVNSIWEQWDLVCDPSGCDALDQLARAMVYGFLIIALMIFYAAARPWTSDLPDVAGIPLAGLVSLVIVWVSRGLVASSGNLRLAAVIIALGLLAVWIGRPEFTERGREPDREQDDLNADASQTSSTR